jgi:hypothetical protein
MTNDIQMREKTVREVQAAARAFGRCSEKQSYDH